KPNYQRISPDRWLRWHISDDSTRWIFAVVDSNGSTSYYREAELAGHPKNIFVTQNYPDGAIAVIWGGRGGVRGTFMRQNLNGVGDNMQISATTDSVSYPTAAYRNDTLFVAWEDYRNGGIPDVDGTALIAPKASRVTE